MRVIIDPRAEKSYKKFILINKSKLFEYIKLLKEYGFFLREPYMKKIERNMWELRPKNFRIFLTKWEGKAVVVHIMRKKSNKISTKTFSLLKKRIKYYQ